MSDCGTVIAYNIRGSDFPSLPNVKVTNEKEKKMRVLQKILFTLAMVAGLSIAAFAQKDEPKKPPPKGNPPVVTPGIKKPPKGDDKPKKSSTDVMIAAKESLADLA